MSLTDENNLEIPTSGVADWDSPLNGNFNILARGFEFKGVAGSAINTGDAVSLVGSAYVVPHNAHSMDLGTRPVGIARTSLGSGDEGQFAISGVIRSLTVFSGNLIPGQFCYVNPSSLGMITTSIAAAQWPVGIALDQNAIMIQHLSRFPENISQISCGEMLVGSQHTFDMDLGARGWVRQIRVISTSVDAFKVIWHSNSTRANSERLFETLTTSVDGGALDFDIQSLDWADDAGWGYKSTNTASPSLIYGTIVVQSASLVGSGTFEVRLDAERFG